MITIFRRKKTGFYFIFLFPAVFFIMLSGPSPVYATYTGKHPDNLFLILDASGSMANSEQGVQKIEVIKKILLKSAEKFRKFKKIGLMVFGHTRAGDCNDVELLLPLKKLDPKLFSKKIKEIHPKGLAPLALALEKAAAILPGKERNLIIFISDGPDTCLGQPCLKAQKLVEKTFSYINVIGYKIDKRSKQQLPCIAKAGKGEYFAAENGQQLETVLAKIMGFSDKSLNKKLSLQGKTAPLTRKLKVKVQKGRVRKSPDFKSPVLFHLKKSETVTIVDENDKWYYIHTINGKSGWAHRSLFQ